MLRPSRESAIPRFACWPLEGRCGKPSRPCARWPLFSSGARRSGGKKGATKASRTQRFSAASVRLVCWPRSAGVLSLRRLPFRLASRKSAGFREHRLWRPAVSAVRAVHGTLAGPHVAFANRHVCRFRYIGSVEVAMHRRSIRTTLTSPVRRLRTVSVSAGPGSR